MEYFAYMNPENRKLKVFFMGSGAFSVPCLAALAESGTIELVGIVTQPDKAAGRKHTLTPTPLGKWADDNRLPCLRAVSVNTPEFLEIVKKANPDIIVVVSFGQLLKEAILNTPEFGCFNVHASLLPKYRGASPITTSLLNGDPETGVTFMRMEKGLDSGPVFEMHRLPISPDITNGELEHELSLLAARQLERCLLRIAAGELTPVPQPREGVTIAVKIRKSDGAVDWHEDAEVIARKVRAYYNWPSMVFRVQLKNRLVNVKITRASGTSWESPQAVPGQFVAYTNNKMMIRCGKGSLVIERIIPEGKKEMAVADFLNGSHISIGEILLNGMDPV